MSKKTLPPNPSLIPKTAKKLFSGVIFDIYQWKQQMFDGSYETFEMAKRSDTVIVIGIVDGKVVIVNEEHPNGIIRKNSFPGGRVDNKDTSVLAAAQREIKEETGYSFKEWKLLNVQQPQSKIEWFVYLYVAWGVDSLDNPSLDSGEKIEIKLLDWDSVLRSGNSKIIGENNLNSYKTIEDLISAKEYMS